MKHPVCSIERKQLSYFLTRDIRMENPTTNMFLGELRLIYCSGDKPEKKKQLARTTEGGGLQDLEGRGGGGLNCGRCDLSSHKKRIICKGRYVEVISLANVQITCK